MIDFTLSTYKILLESLQYGNCTFQSFAQYLKEPAPRSVILRHDVDAKKLNSLATAKLENELGIRGTYYFRMVPESFDEGVIRKIYELGHEVGYHYEDVSMVAVRGARYAVRGTEGPKDPLLGGVGVGFFHRAHSSNKLPDALVTDAIGSFQKNLDILRRIVPIETICMHGSPLSQWDNRLLWNYYDYKDYGIIGEPYFDLDFNEVLYLTDTGRRWDGEGVSVRDKAQGAGHRAQGDRLTPHASLLTPHARFHSTFDIIDAAQSNALPDKIMITVHPQRWTNKPLPWLKELVWQNVKNAGKWMVVRLTA